MLRIQLKNRSGKREKTQIRLHEQKQLGTKESLQSIYHGPSLPHLLLQSLYIVLVIVSSKEMIQRLRRMQRLCPSPIRASMDSGFYVPTVSGHYGTEPQKNVDK